MRFSDFHVHTSYCDGKNTPKDMVMAAIDKNLSSLGLLCHSYLPFDEGYCIRPDKINAFKNEINSLKEQYKDKINIFCGVEADYFSSDSYEGFDYKIGSVHFVKKDGLFLPIDISKEITAEIIEKHYGKNPFALCRDYFSNVIKCVEKFRPDIIGHFDLISKSNSGNAFFDEKDSRYTRLWKEAVDTLLKYRIPFELNTGAVFAGYKTTPYPSMDILSYILTNGGQIVLSSDSHTRTSIAFAFEKYQKELSSAGFSVFNPANPFKEV